MTPDGTEVWSVDTPEARPASLAVHADGGDLALGGETAASDPVGWVARFSAEGQQKWSRDFAELGIGAGSVSEIAIDATHGIVAAGYVGSSEAGSGFALVVQKFSTTGELEWQYVEDESKPYLSVTGLAVSPIRDEVIVSTDERIVGLTSDGQLLWTWTPDQFGLGSGCFTALAVDSCGDLALAWNSGALLKIAT